MKYVKMFLLIVLFLTSCTSSIQPPTQTPTLTLTSAPTATQTLSPTSTIVPTPTQIGGGSGKVIFTLNKSAYEKLFPDLAGETNVFTSNSDGTELTPITSGLKSVTVINGISPDGDKALVASYSSTNASSGSLYIVDVVSENTIQFKLLSGVDQEYAPGHPATWVDNARIAYIGNGKEGHGIYIINIDGTNAKKISASISKFSVMLAANTTQIYWHRFVERRFAINGNAYTSGSFSSVWWANIDGSAEGLLESGGKEIVTGQWRSYAFSPDGKNIAWIPTEYPPDCLHWFFLAGHLRDGIYTEQAGGKDAWFMIGVDPSDIGKVIDLSYVKDYAQRCFILYVASLSDMDNPTKIVLMPPDNFINREFVFGKKYELKWSPDGSKIAILYRGIDHNPYIGNYQDAPVLFFTTLTDQTPKLNPIYFFSQKLAENIFMINFSPDGEQIRLFENTDDWRVRFFDLQKLDYVNNFENNQNLEFGKIYNLYWLP